MLKTILNILYIFTFAFINSLYAQTISSTPTGGLWNSTATWVGGVVPTASHDVVINGPVQATYGSTCRNLTINSGATLQCEAYYRTLTVVGNLTNNGIIQNHAAGYTLTINVSGNVTNNGTWKHDLTRLNGTQDQTLSLGSGKSFQSLFESSDTLGVIVASSALEFHRSFNLKNARFNMQNYSLTLLGGGNIRNGYVFNTKDLVGKEGAGISDITYDGAINIKNRIYIGYGVTMRGTVTVVDTLQNGAWNYTLTVDGNLVNNGIIQNHAGGWTLTINVSGNVTNNGTWKHDLTRLNGTQDQTLSLGSGKSFQSLFESSDTLGVIVASSALEFHRSFDLKNARFNMQNYSLTLLGGGNIRNGYVFNTKDLVGKEGAEISNIVYDGTINIKNRIYIGNGVTMRGTVTVVDTLQNGAWNYTLTVDGNLVNNGIIQNHAAGYTLTINVSGNVTNNGTWNHSLTRLTGQVDQTLSLGTDKVFGSAFESTDTLRVIKASTALEFQKSFDLKKSVLNMQTNSLTLQGSGNIANGRVINTKDITGKGNPVINNITYEGNINIKQRVWIEWNVTMRGTVTVVDTLQNGAWNYTLTVDGNLVNNGIIQNHAAGWWLTINVSGNVTNNGTWNHSLTRLTGQLDQTLSLGTDKVFGSAFESTDTLGVIIAGTTLEFQKSFDLKKSVLNMQNKALILQGSGNIANGRVINTKDITGKGNPVINNITYEGNINIKQRVWIGWNVTMRGTVTVVDTLQNGAWNYTLTVDGNLVNNGIIQNHAAGWWLTINVSGNVTNNGTWNIGATRLTGSGRRTVNATGIQGAIEATGTNVVLTGHNIFPRLTVAAGAYCEVAGDGTLLFLEGTVAGRLVNKGEVITRKKITATGDHTFYGARVRFVSITGLDSLTIRHFGYSVPSSFTNALKAYWRLEPVPKNSPLTLDQLTLDYDDAQLGSNVESTLQVFHSTDSAQTWRQISTPLSIFHDIVNNFVRVNNASISGDYVLSSSANPLTFRPSIVVSIIGRSQIRVGAPNRYSVNYVNNSDTPTEDFLLAINTGARIHILKTEHPLADGKREIIPADSLFYEGEDTTLVLYVAGMAPREERTFDIIATADNLGMVSNPRNNETAFIDPLSITVGTVVIWAAKAAAVYVAVKAIDYVGDKAREGLEFTPEEKRQWEQRIGPIPEELKRTETKKEWAAKAIGTKIIEKTMGIVGGGVDLVRAVGRNIWNLGPNLRRRFFNWAYKEIGLIPDEKIDDKTYKPEVSGGNVKTTQRVTSWDPNEKHGPAGVGENGFISKAGRINYQILFENLKTATAPAWKIVIVDTLRPEFDPATVEFGNKSHEGDQYVWNITRTENVLRWEIEDIELPPNVNPPEGEGYVTFSVLPHTALPTGTVLRNKATIVFDINPPIVTNEFVNTYDFVPPVTTMLPLPSEINESPLIVRFSSSDGVQGSGVQSVSIYASKDGGPFNFVGTTYIDSLAVDVTNGDYEFYGLAVDLVGNVEQVRPELVKTKVTGVVGVEDEISETPKIYFLSQNYPNPFNPNTIVKYQLPVGSKVTLKIYNMLGQEVKTLVDEVQEAGYQFIEWNSTNNSGNTVASGVYFYRIEATSITDPSKTFTQVRKMLLLR